MTEPKPPAHIRSQMACLELAARLDSVDDRETW